MRSPKLRPAPFRRRQSLQGGRSMSRLTLTLTLCVALLAGCGRSDRPNDEKPQAQLDAKPQANGEKPNGAKPGDGDAKKGDPVVDPAKLPLPAIFTADEKQEKYEAALNDALEMLAQRKLPEALVAMETARTFSDNDFIRGEIAKVKQRLDQDSAAKS